MADEDDFVTTEEERKAMYSSMYEAINFASPDKLKSFPLPGEEEEKDYQKLNKNYGPILLSSIRNIFDQQRARDWFGKIGWGLCTLTLIAFGTYNFINAISPKEKPITTHCYHHTLQPNRTLDDAVSYFRSVDPNATAEKIKENLQFSGQDITYCFQK